jgi:hypothetical protein
MLLMAIAFSGMVFAQDPYMNHSYPWYDGWWLFCGFDGDGYVKGIESVLVYNWSHPDSAGICNKVFTSDTVLEFWLSCPRSEVDTTQGWFDVKLVHNDTVRFWMRNDTSRYHLHVNDIENSVVVDFDIEPVVYHPWAGRYFATLEAALVGTVKVDTEEYAVTGNCSFEHAWGEETEAPSDSAPEYAYSHYETLTLYDSLGTRYGAMHWPWLRTTGEGYVNMPGGTSLPDHGYHPYPREDYSLEYLEKSMVDGYNMPKKWKITANTGNGSLEYIGTGIRVSEFIPSQILVGAFSGAVHIYTEYTGMFTPTVGASMDLTGKGVLEFGYGTHDPLYSLDERSEYKFDFGNNEVQTGFKKVHALSPYGIGGYGFAFSSLDLSKDADLTQYGNTGIHSDCAWLYYDSWYFWLDVPNGTYTVKLYWGVTDSTSAQTFDIYDGKAGGGPHELEADSVGDATYPNEATVEDIQIENEAIEIQIHRNSDVLCHISALEVMRETSVEEKSSNYQLPTGNMQLSIHPNPATHNVVVEFGVRLPALRCREQAGSREFVDVETRHVMSLQIHDLSGRVVRSLNLCNLDKSVKSVVWDGKDDSGRKVSAGIYFCKLEAGNSKILKKLVLLR